MDERLIYLFHLYFEKTASSEELDELFRLLEVSADDEQLTLLISKAWENLQLDGNIFSESESNLMLGKILRTVAPEKKIAEQPAIKKMFPWRKFAAAIIILFAGTGIWIGLKGLKENKPPVTTETAQLHDALPGGNRAVLRLANGSSIILTNAHNGILARQGSSMVRKIKNGQLVYSIVGGNKRGAPLINTISTPRGGQYQVVLPDGTEVWLNAASSLKYPTFFAGKKREVEIKGEAYFEVAKNPSMPFIVKSKRAEVEVLGTHFDVMAYDDEPAMETTLLEGSVKITSGKSSGILKPGEQAVLDSTEKLRVVDHVDTEDVVAWKDGLFEFNDADVESIMRQAARWYDVKIIYRGKIPSRQYTGRISRNVNASQLLNMLQYTGLNARIEGKNIIITK